VSLNNVLSFPFFPGVHESYLFRFLLLWIGVFIFCLFLWGWLFNGVAPIIFVIMQCDFNIFQLFYFRFIGCRLGVKSVYLVGDICRALMHNMQEAHHTDIIILKTATTYMNIEQLVQTNYWPEWTRTQHPTKRKEKNRTLWKAHYIITDITGKNTIKPPTTQKLEKMHTLVHNIRKWKGSHSYASGKKQVRSKNYSRTQNYE
jgi:hypothetical protein